MTKREAATIFNKKKCMVGTPVGELELVEDGKGICSLSFGASSENGDVPEEETELLLEAKRQLLEYFAGAPSTRQRSPCVPPRPFEQVPLGRLEARGKLRQRLAVRKEAGRWEWRTGVIPLRSLFPVTG